MATINYEKVKRIAGFELNALRSAEILGAEFENVKLPRAGTPVYDLNGEILFYRMPLSGRRFKGYTDVASNEVFGEPLLATSYGQNWNERSLIKLGREHAKKINPRIKFDDVKFVAYSYPKIALQFLHRKKEVLLLELYSWEKIPEKHIDGRKKLEPSHFERWSLIEELPDKFKRKRTQDFKDRVKKWESPVLKRVDVLKIKKEILFRHDMIIKLFDRRELHYSTDLTDHYPCYELRGQQTGVWCVGASCEMLLNFYRYNYDQVRLAEELGLGTLNNPNGLPYANVGDVVTVLENLTSNALNVTMFQNPDWNLFRDEIRANRPLISFVPGHSRTVAGYTQSLISFVNDVPFKGLLVYDPWPPNAGVITRWENFNTQIYQYAYSAELNQI